MRLMIGLPEKSSILNINKRRVSETMKLINTHDQLVAAVEAGTITKRQAIAVSYYAKPSGRMGYAECARAAVWSPFFAVDPQARWYEHGAKSFLRMSGPWKDAVKQAKKWASDRFKISAWARNRVGEWVPTIVNENHPIPRREKTSA
jgi:hypothetical protein